MILFYSKGLFIEFHLMHMISFKIITQLVDICIYRHAILKFVYQNHVDSMFNFFASKRNFNGFIHI